MFLLDGLMVLHSGLGEKPNIERSRCGGGRTRVLVNPHFGLQGVHFPISFNVGDVARSLKALNCLGIVHGMPMRSLLDLWHASLASRRRSGHKSSADPRQQVIKATRLRMHCYNRVAGDCRSQGALISGANSNLDQRLDRRQRRIWKIVSHSPLESLWNLQGVPVRVVTSRTWKSVHADRIFGHAAELGFYFLFALFPTLFCAGSILGPAARSADQMYDRLLDYLALVIPTSALGTVLKTFNETTAAASSDKLTFGTIAAIWSASVGISAIQDTLNAVYKIKESRSYFVARLYAIALTLLLMVVGTLTLAAMFAGDFVAALAYHHLHDYLLAIAAAV